MSVNHYSFSDKKSVAYEFISHEFGDEMQAVMLVLTNVKAIPIENVTRLLKEEIYEFQNDPIYKNEDAYFESLLADLDEIENMSSRENEYIPLCNNFLISSIVPNEKKNICFLSCENNTD